MRHPTVLSVPFRLAAALVTALTVLVTGILPASAEPARPLPAIVVVSIPDAQFRECLRLRLGLAPGVPIWDVHLNAIPTLDCSVRPISNLTGWQHLINMTDFSGYEMNLTGSLTVPAQLTRLERINLNRNTLTTISFPAALTGLKEIRLIGNRLHHISLTNSATRIQDVHLGNNRLTDLSSLSWMPTSAQVHAGAQQIPLPTVPLGVATTLTLRDHRGRAPALTVAFGTTYSGGVLTNTTAGTKIHSFTQTGPSTPYGTYSGLVVQTATMAPATGKLGDHTGDGLTDIFATDAGGNLLFFRGSASGPATFLGSRGSGLGPMTSMNQINDITGDNRSDLLMRRGGDQSLWLYRSISLGYLEPWQRMGQNWGGMDQIVPAFNLAGGSTQYVVARRASDGLLFRYTLTAAGLTDIRLIGQHWQGMRQILSVGDFNADGRSDVLAIRASDGTLWAYDGTPQGTIGAGRQVGHGWNGFIRGFSAGDMSGDGRHDLLSQRNDGAVFVYNNLIGRWAPARQIMSGASGYVLMA